MKKKLYTLNELLKRAYQKGYRTGRHYIMKSVCTYTGQTFRGQTGWLNDPTSPPPKYERITGVNTREQLKNKY